MKRILFFALILSSIIATSCLKSLEEEGVSTSTVCKGTVVTTDGSAVGGMYVQSTGGDRQGASTVTASDGTFSLEVTYEELRDGYWLALSADSLYLPTRVPLDAIGFGVVEYDLQYITVEGPQLATITTDEVSGIDRNSAVCGGTISDDGRSAVRRRGICWSTSANPTVVNSHVDVGSGTGHFTAAIAGLAVEQTYYVRAYAENGVGIAYGEQRTFTTISGKPLVTTGAITAITQTSANCAATVVNDYGNAVTARGFCWSSVNPSPTVNDQHSSDGTGGGTFNGTISGLQSGTAYYVRAYATNALGTGYGEVKQFTTF